jgi:hypothetical protein
MTVATRKPKADPATLPPSGGKRSHAAEPVPTLEEVRARLAAAAGRPRPWFTPEGLAVFADAPTEDLGPDIYKHPDAE